MASSPSLYLGIDTGGTFTDGVLFDPRAHTVIKTAKVLTTHHDLTLCIDQVLEILLNGNGNAVSLVSLSTTLATNAIVEGKRRPVGLLLIGYDSELVANHGFQPQFGTPYTYYVEGRHDREGREHSPLDRQAVARICAELENQVEAFAVASYYGPQNAGHENQSAEIIGRRSRLPVVQAHTLSNELDSIRRATTASLNAALLPHIETFLDAVRAMIARRGINCPVTMVRGDGSLVRTEFARRRPVEIIQSGPATSALGGQFLSGVDAALVIDIGGTTTDMALVNQRKALLETGTATVGSYRTCVRTIKTRSFGLGGDSLIAFDRARSLSIGPQRAVPLSYLCHVHPEVKADLADWLTQTGPVRESERLEYWRLRRLPRQPLAHPRAAEVIDLLKSGPQRLTMLLKQTRASRPEWLGSEELLRLNIIERAGLTPTDLLHASGEFTPWDVETARLVVAAAAAHWQEPPPVFIQRVKAAITEHIVAEVVQFLSGKPLSGQSAAQAYHNNFYSANQPLDRWLFAQALTPNHPYLACRLSLNLPIVGIGAPASVFLPPAAAALNAELRLPEHYQVANAVGAVVGSVVIRREGDVFPCIEGTQLTGYYARGGGGQQKFDSFDEALAHTRQTLTHLATEEALAAGAQHPEVEVVITRQWDGMAHLAAYAVGKPAQTALEE